MMLKMSYFITNIFFVVSLVAMLFLHRAVSETKKNEQTPEVVAKLKNLKVLRTLLVIATIVFFVSMCASFIADMYYNG